MSEPVTYISLQWIKPLLKRLNSSHQKRRKIIETISDIFGDPLEYLKYYIEPNCQHENPADLQQDAPIAVPQGGVFRLLNNFLNSEIIQRDGSSHMIILADAGMGKTSLLIFFRLTHLLAFWPKKYNCFILKLGSDTLESIKKIPFPVNTILLLDALDEDPETRHRIEQRLYEIVSATRKFYRVVITCRTKYFPLNSYPEYHSSNKIKIGPYACPLVYLSLFDNEQVKEYLHKRFPKKLKHKIVFSENPIFTKSLRVINMMGSLKFRPLLLSYIDEFIDCDLNGLVEYTIYDILVRKWIDREIQKIHRIHKNYSINPESLLHACAIIAVFMHRSEVKTIKENQLEFLIEKAPYLKYFKDFDFGGRSLLNRTSEGAYRFSHYSILEYLVAYAILNNKIVESEKHISPTDLILHFVFQKISPNVVLKQIDLSNQVFKNKDFSNLDLSECKLNNSIFSHVNFFNANFSQAQAKCVQFLECNMTGSSLFNANFEMSDLSNSNLSSANLTFTRLIKANLQNVILNNVNLTDTLLASCNLKGTGITKYTIKKYMHKNSFSDSNKLISNSQLGDPIYDEDKITWKGI